MNIQEAKQIKIADYLQSLGHRPVKQQGANLWYKSPLRNESEASFKVNTTMNSWFDFGMGKGGNIITLVSYLYASDNLPYLLDKMEKQTPHVRPTNFSFTQQLHAVLKSLCLSLDVAVILCRSGMPRIRSTDTSFQAILAHGFRTDSRSSRCIHCTSGMRPSHGSREQSRWQV
jgi:hypothetical protein